MATLITGGAGFIGSHLSERLLGRGRAVVCLDDFNDFYNPAIKRSNAASLGEMDGFTLVEGDIRDTELVDRIFQNHPIDLVVHLAARAGVRPSLTQTRLYEQVNVLGTINLLEASRARGVNRFVFASSSSVYGDKREIPFSEDDRVDRPVSPYAATKKAGEEICYTYHHLYGMDITCLRFFTVYGPGQRPEMAIHKFSDLIDRGEPLPFYGDGTSGRDYTYISDIVDGIEGAIGALDGYNIFNLGGTRTTSLQDLVRLLEGALGKKAILDRLPMQPGDVTITCADVSRAHQAFGYAPHVPIEEGIEHFVAWYRGRGG